jgi:hypothetical protein
MVCDLARAGLRPIFNGLTLEGWHEGDVNGNTAAGEHWSVGGNVIHFDGKGRDLWTNESFGDFEMQVDWRWTGEHQGKMNRPYIGLDGKTVKNPDGSDKVAEVEERDSGIYLRGNSKSQVNMWVWPCGSGEVYGYRTDAALPPEIRAACAPRLNADAPVGQWNRFRIRMIGETLNVWLNGKHVLVDARLPGVPKTGPIALQCHGSPIEFTNVMVESLDSK